MFLMTSYANHQLAGIGNYVKRIVIIKMIIEFTFLVQHTRSRSCFKIFIFEKNGALAFLGSIVA